MYHLVKQCITNFGKSKIFKYALITNTAFGIILRSFGDVVQQKIELNTKLEKERAQLDWTRTSK